MIPGNNILVTNCWLRSSYAVLRNLHSHGINVHVADNHSVGMSQWSRYKKSFDSYQSHYEDEQRFINDIVDICGKRDISLIIPTHNDTEVLSRNLHLLPPGVGRLLPNSEYSSLFNNKSDSYKLARSLGIPVADTISYENLDDLKVKLESDPWERYVIKTLTGNSSKGVFYADSGEEAFQVVKKLLDKYSLKSDRLPQVERYVSGQGWGCSVLYWNGELVASFTHRRLREKISTGGTSTFREAATNALLLTYTKKILDHVRWHGFAMCEFKVCPDTGKIWFIEINPRLWGSLPLAVSAGVEFPYLAYLSSFSGVDEAKNYMGACKVASSWRSRWLLGDSLVALKLLAGADFSGFRDVVWGQSADYLDDWFWDDPMVFFGEVAVYMSNSLKAGSSNPIVEGMVR